MKVEVAIWEERSSEVTKQKIPRSRPITEDFIFVLEGGVLKFEKLNFRLGDYFLSK